MNKKIEVIVNQSMQIVWGLLFGVVILSNLLRAQDRNWQSRQLAHLFALSSVILIVLCSLIVIASVRRIYAALRNDTTISDSHTDKVVQYPGLSADMLCEKDSQRTSRRWNFFCNMGLMLWSVACMVMLLYSSGYMSISRTEAPTNGTHSDNPLSLEQFETGMESPNAVMNKPLCDPAYAPACPVGASGLSEEELCDPADAPNCLVGAGANEEDLIE